MKNSNVIGIDLAKNVLQVCKVSKHGELTVNKAIVSRQKIWDTTSKKLRETFIHYSLVSSVHI